MQLILFFLELNKDDLEVQSQTSPFLKKGKTTYMEKLMTLDILSSIKGAQASEAVDNLFEIIKKANPDADSEQTIKQMAVTLDGLRADEVISSGNLERELIIENFPKSKNGYLVVTKVMED